MSVGNFRFTKIQAEKKTKKVEKVRVMNNISVKEVKEETPGPADGRAVIRVSFEFTTSYDPDVGSIQLTSDVYILESEENKKKLLETWKTDKKVPAEFTEALFNLVLKKSNIKALNIADDLKLPSPINLGRVKVKSENA